MGSAEGGSHQLSKLLYLSKYNRLRCSRLNPVTSTDTRRKEMHKDFRGVIIFSREGPDVILRAKINVGLLWKHIHSRSGSLKYPMKQNTLHQWVKLFRCESGPGCGWWVRGWPKEWQPFLSSRRLVPWKNAGSVRQMHNCKERWTARCVNLI